ncbi:hypothetical protein LSAT2_026937 [Lamellibrachia satsuma]|nr:hypothetical protein LSAT2_026937 [Lamellibrachia satsuma]
MYAKQRLLALSFLLYAIWSTLVTYTNAAKPSRCATELKVLWRRAVGSAPFASMPLVTYVDGDDKLDIVAVPSTGDVYVLQGENGQNLLSGHWPYTAQQTSVHASPIQVFPPNIAHLNDLPTAKCPLAHYPVPNPVGYS